MRNTKLYFVFRISRHLKKFFSDANKRLGFARSEEVGIPGEGGATTTVSTTTSNTALAPPELIKQNSKESTDSSDK